MTRLVRKRSAPRGMVEEPPTAQVRRATSMDMGVEKKKRLIVATRLHLKSADHLPSLEPLKAFLSSFWEVLRLRCGIADLDGKICHDAIYVAVGCEGTLGMALLKQVEELVRMLPNEEDDPSINVLPIAPWGNFLASLNHLVGIAASGGFDSILFASVEATLSSDDLGILETVLDSGPDGQLVAGVALDGHDFRAAPGKGVRSVPLTGCTMPWNTLALWNAQKLAKFGFPLIAEGIVQSHNDQYVLGGVEEAGAIGLALLHLRPHCGDAWVVKLTNSSWDTESFANDPGRLFWHKMKLRSKVDRVEQQMKTLHLDVGALDIKHLDCSAGAWRKALEKHHAAYQRPIAVANPVAKAFVIEDVRIDLSFVVVVHFAAFAVICMMSLADRYRRAHVA